MVAKSKVTLDGVPLAGNIPIVWRLQTGTAPYATVMQVHKSQWSKLQSKMGKPVTLSFQSSSATVNIQRVYILHNVASDSPNRIAFVVADTRWQWPYTFVSFDINMTKKSGNRDILRREVPYQTNQYIDRFDFKLYSLKLGQRKWEAEELLTAVLKIATGQNSYYIDSLPLESGSSENKYTLQNVVIRDTGDAAVARALSYIPGAQVYIDTSGTAVVFDGTDLEAAQKHKDALPKTTWDGEVTAVIDRKAIRPSKVNVYYTREVEVRFDYNDDYYTSASRPTASDPFLVNVIPTVDPETDLEIYNPDTGEYETTTVPQGTWVEVNRWLKAMDKDKSGGSAPWTFETIKRFWMMDLAGVLGGGAGRGVPDANPEGNAALRVAALYQHFRQTFKINPRYMSRIRQLIPTRVAPFDPVTGARGRANVWGQYAYIPSMKGRISSRNFADTTAYGVNIDSYPDGEKTLDERTPSPAQIDILDEDQGIFRVSWLQGSIGTIDRMVPCMLVNGNDQVDMMQRALRHQDQKSVLVGSVMSGEAKGMFLAPQMDLAVVLTCVLGAPNNKNQFHKVEVKPSDVKKLFRSKIGIEEGDGPEIDIFVQPGEAVVQFAVDVQAAKGTIVNTVRDLFGANDQDPETAGLPTNNLPGYVDMNTEREIKNHSQSVAAEALAQYANALSGTPSTALPSKFQALQLKGNMSGVNITVATAPSAKIVATYEYTGRQRPISRFALMSDSARRVVLGIVPHK